MTTVSQKWICLNSEASISSNSLTAGLKIMKKAAFEHNQYIFAFFNLSIGLERLFKLIIVCESLRKNKNIGEQNFKKNFGHDLTKLKLQVDEILNCNNISNNLCEISNSVIAELSNFAIAERYYNLNYILGKNTSLASPISSWHNKVGYLIWEKHLEELIGIDLTLPEIKFFGFDETLLKLTKQKELASIYLFQLLNYKYACYYVHQIIYTYIQYFFVTDGDIHEKQLDIPYLYEFFVFLNTDSKKYINRHKYLRRKK